VTNGRPLSIGEQARELFDAKAATWPAKYVPDSRMAGGLSRLSAAAQQYLPPGGRLLDLGCGTGDLDRTLAAGGFRVTGCDISAEMLDRAALARDTDSVSWARLDPGWQALSFGPSTFDVVVASSVPDYVDNPRAVLRECARVLRRQVPRRRAVTTTTPRVPAIR
jgi:2-polyprenyl-3-methyl-5-hydroxy-6-metoxy-1,4-benzoquinol methylase